MNTKNQETVPLLSKEYRNYIFIFEDLELAFPLKQLERITDQWNSGMDVDEISDKQKRHPKEVFLALVHLADKHKLKRPFAYRM